MSLPTGIYLFFLFFGCRIYIIASHGLAVTFNDPIEGLYTSNASAPLGDQQGLRQLYKFGLYSYCAYVTETLGVCSNHTIAKKFDPYLSITSDMSANYTQFTDAIYHGTAIQNTSYLGASSQAAYWMVLLGTLCAVLAFSTSVISPSSNPSKSDSPCSGLVKHTVAFLASTCFAILGSLLLLIGASIWTVAINKVETINPLSYNQTSVPLGITASTGPGLYMIWAAFACLLISTAPYMSRYGYYVAMFILRCADDILLPWKFSCCTYRG
jgi:SUR7/PalI family